jgi:hypothetical protein
LSKTKRFFTGVLLVVGLLSCVSAVDYERRFSGFVPTETLTDDWYGVYFSGAKVGWEHIEITKGTLAGDDVIRVRDDGVVIYRMEDENNPVKNVSSGEVYLTTDERLAGFRYSQTLDSHELSIVGETKRGVVYVDVTSGGSTQRIKFNESEKIYPSTALSYFSLKEEIVPGKTYSYRVFLEPLRLVEDLAVTVEKEEEVTVGGKVEKAYLVRGKIRGYTITSYVQADGRVVKQITMDNFVALREPKEEATLLSADSGITMADIIDFSLATPNRPIPDPGGLSLLEVRITGIPEATPPLASDYQLVTGPDSTGAYTYALTRADLPLLSVPPYGGFPKGVGKFLLSSLEIESGHEKIIKTAHEIVGEPTDPLTDAQKITRWVYKNLKKEMVDTTSALDTLTSMEGECQAHANLLAALLRAQGIPTKVVSGIVYAEEIGGFLYHSWNEAYLGAWVPVDAAFGQFPADVTHIKFAEGGPESIIDTIPLVGAITVEVLDMRRN